MDIPQVQVPGSEKPDAQKAPSNSNEVEMTGTQDAPDATAPDATATATVTTTDQVEETQAGDNSMLDAPAETDNEMVPPAKKNAGFKFLDFLTSPIVEIVIGEGDNATTLTAHQTLLIESPFLSEFVDKFESSSTRRILLPGENVEAFGCFLQFQYTHDYTVTEPETPDSQDPSRLDTTGEQLLRHARVYTLAEKLGMPVLKRLAHKKIHQVNGTPSGELAYARYVYTHTPEDDITIRKPVASYWAARSHILRHGIEEEWRKICIDIPEFSYDVLTIVLNKREKTSQSEAESTPRGRGAKRLRSEK